VEWGSGTRSKGSAVVVAFVDMDIVVAEGLEEGRRVWGFVAVVDGRMLTTLEKSLARTLGWERSALHWGKILFGPEAGCCWIDPIHLDHAHLVLLCFLDRLCLDLCPSPAHGVGRGFGLEMTALVVDLQEVLLFVPLFRGGWWVEPVECIRHRPSVEYHRNSSPLLCLRLHFDSS
jgi:hypothetical protein